MEHNQVPYYLDSQAVSYASPIGDSIWTDNAIKKVSNFQIDSLENIAVGKLLALFGRADAKDFIDMYFILESEKKITFNKLFNLAKKKDAGLSEFYLAGMMEKVVEIEYFPKTIKPLNEKNLKNYFMIFSDKLFKKIKP